MEQERIILIATSDINYDQRLQKIANSLQKAGADVSLVGRVLPGSEPLKGRSFKQERLLCFFNTGVLFYLEINLRFFFFLLGKKATKIVANDVDTLLAATLACKFKATNLYFDAHEYFTEVPELEGKNFKKKLWSWVEAYGVKRAKACYTVNESLARIFEEKYQRKFGVVRNTPVLEKANQEDLQEDFILYQGAINKGRGIEELIDAISDLDVVFKIAGKGDLEEELKFLVKEKGLEAKVKFLGNLSPEDLKILSRKAKIGINVLEAKSLNYYYSLANKFFDYMHAELPQISMNFPEYALIVKQYKVALLIDDLDAQSIRKAILTLQNNEDLYQAMKVQSQAAKEVFNWQVEEKALLAIYFS